MKVGFCTSVYKSYENNKSFATTLWGTTIRNEGIQGHGITEIVVCLKTFCIQKSLFGGFSFPPYCTLTENMEEKFSKRLKTASFIHQTFSMKSWEKGIFIERRMQILSSLLRVRSIQRGREALCQLQKDPSSW